MRILSLLFLLLPLGCLAQFSINGNIVNAADGKPVPDASVFINNATIGTKSNADGSFILKGLNSGQYDLIISVVGFERYRNTIVIDRNIGLPNIKLAPKTAMMNEVTVMSKDPYRARKVRMFKEQFLGTSEFADKCKLLNPEVLKLKFTQKQKILTGSTDDFLEIENKALGYKIKYLLNSFTLDKIAFKMAYEGFVLFEEMDGTPAQKEKWQKGRRDVYYGSPIHFLRAVLADKADSDFVVRTFCIKKIDTIKRIGKWRALDYRTGDTTTFYVPRYDQLTAANYVSKTDKRGIYAIQYPEDLDVFYFPPGVNHERDPLLEYGNRGQIGSFDFIDKNIFFDYNGTILNPNGALFRYRWGRYRTAELLPIDYWPALREAKGKTLADSGVY